LSRPTGPREVLTMFATACTAMTVVWSGKEGRGGARGVSQEISRGVERRRTRRDLEGARDLARIARGPRRVGTGTRRAAGRDRRPESRAIARARSRSPLFPNEKTDAPVPSRGARTVGRADVLSALALAVQQFHVHLAVCVRPALVTVGRRVARGSCETRFDRARASNRRRTKDRRRSL
jgi:hypothetical protein